MSAFQWEAATCTCIKFRVAESCYNFFRNLWISLKSVRNNYIHTRLLTCPRQSPRSPSGSMAVNSTLPRISSSTPTTTKWLSSPTERARFPVTSPLDSSSSGWGSLQPLWGLMAWPEGTGCAAIFPTHPWLWKPCWPLLALELCGVQLHQTLESRSVELHVITCNYV